MADFDQPRTGHGAGFGTVSTGGTSNGVSGHVDAGTYPFANYTHPMEQSYQASHQTWDEPDPEDLADEPLAGPANGSWARVVTMMGGVASLALVVGIGIWGYKLVMRDVSGVPVVRAIEGPMRVQPADPGGKPADHQGLAVNAVAAQGTAAAPADRLALAPSPVSLSEDDTAGLSDAAEPVVPAPIQETQAEAEQVAAVADEALAAFQNGQVDALVRELTDGVPSLLDDPAEDEGESVAPPPAEIVQPEPLAPVELTTTPTPQPAVVTGPGVARSLRPTVRPARLTQSQAVTAAVQSATDTSASLDVDPDTLPAGTRLAQLGAYESAEIARSEWERLNGRFGDYLDGKKRVIQKASSGGRTFYRLRAMGFDDLSDARRFCSALVAGKADCIPVTTR